MDIASQLFGIARNAGEVLRLKVGPEQHELLLVWCPPGKFVMGCSDFQPWCTEFEQPQHVVTLTSGFWISQTPVSRAMWHTAIPDTPISPGEDQKYGNHPLAGISWGRAVEFCLQLTEMLRADNILRPNQQISLPTEAQWEYACRAGTRSTWFFGEDASKLGDYAWYEGNSTLTSYPVANKKPNPWGLYNTYGSVAEWCLDSPYLYQSGNTVDPCVIDAESNLRVVRGGSYMDGITTCNSVRRQFVFHNNKVGEDTGIRLVCTETMK